jgi:hypothetical protein
VSLTQHCREIIVGAILGDACLERNGKNVRLRIDHGHQQQTYVEWKHQELFPLSPSAPRRVDVHDPRTQQVYVHYRFVSKTTEELNEYFELFYGNEGTKRIPDTIAAHLSSALSVAVWYMDDGGRRSDCRSGYFNTQGYTAEEVDLLRSCLLENFKLPTTLHFAAKRPRIYIASSHFETFCDWIRPHVIPDMRYKLL